MKITELRITGLSGGTVEGGWVDDLKPEEDINTIVEVVTDQGLSGIGSAMTSKALIDASVKLLRPLLIGERADEPARVSEKLRQSLYRPGCGGSSYRTYGGCRRQRAVLAARLQMGPGNREDAGWLRRGLVRGSLAARRPGRLHRTAPARPLADHDRRGLDAPPKFSPVPRAPG